MKKVFQSESSPKQGSFHYLGLGPGAEIRFKVEGARLIIHIT